LVVPQARPAAFDAAGLVPLRLEEDDLYFDFLGSFFCRSVVSIIFLLSGLEPRDDSFVSGVPGEDAAAGTGDGESLRGEEDEGAGSFNSRDGAGVNDTAAAGDGLTGNGGGFDKSI
jgi:hypothetical protein